MSGGFWDGPWYRYRRENYVVAFLPGADEALDEVDNVDVFVSFDDGSRWSATVFTLAEVRVLMERWAESGECLGGRFFWCSDGLIVRDAGVAAMVDVVDGLIETGEYTTVLQRLGDECPDP